MRRGRVSGAVSLIMIFCVLCLSVFAVLTLSTAVGEKKLTDLTAERAQDWYAADRQAVAAVAALERGETPQDVDVAFTQEAEGTQAEFTLPAGGEQILTVKVLLSDGGYEILCWRTDYGGDWAADDTIAIWDGA